MMFIEKIESLLKERNIRKKDFLIELNLNKNSFSAWKARGTVPNGTVLQKIADYFGVSVDYLLGKSTNDTGCTSDLLLTDEETALISAYRKNPQFHEAIKKLLSF